MKGTDGTISANLIDQENSVEYSSTPYQNKILKFQHNNLKESLNVPLSSRKVLEEKTPNAVKSNLGTKKDNFSCFKKLLLNN